MDIVTYLQGRGCHGIDVLLAIKQITETKKTESIAYPPVGWKDVKDAISMQGKRISDMTYRARRDELVEMHLVELVPLDDMRANVKMTKRGMIIASIVEVAVAKLNAVAKLKDVEKVK